MSLINELIQSKYLKSPEIIDAFRKIKREDFLLDQDEGMAEVNVPLSIGHGQTISQPLTVAFMLELLRPEKGDKILDIGSGSGWTVALLAQIIGKKGKIYGVERIEELKKFAENNILKYNFINKGIVEIIHGDGYKGLPGYAPFDKIIIAAAAEEIPTALLKQLKVGGRLVIPVGRQYETQDIVAVDKIGKDEFKEKRYPGFVFVPLVKSHNA
ncbi:protein-L-isoaspartate O-methyltransferase [Patescibacteria group bacterium]|nr:protein-L-isoaspartate O-methyltransferase [Candidatus Falkowbacteria bacterium]MBU3905526.1 protein-L-isoaspartate O-methyltransferase [Patescibacteria group bacterium]MBU4015166.1 protein-L-isoaspartate O-methyltransferase [Patescibacteria group bacterium]MBU4026982.1 protein-L-isoaspartate O-methyltransferase [Patescibacteria group bacterium]MBU4073712.1 protein-L-isoaspartate O-methyltransferase [Patescibacteria group bacterium]